MMIQISNGSFGKIIEAPAETEFGHQNSQRADQVEIRISRLNQILDLTFIVLGSIIQGIVRGYQIQIISRGRLVSQYSNPLRNLIRTREITFRVITRTRLCLLATTCLIHSGGSSRADRCRGRQADNRRVDSRIWDKCQWGTPCQISLVRGIGLTISLRNLHLWKRNPFVKWEYNSPIATKA